MESLEVDHASAPVLRPPPPHRRRLMLVAVCVGVAICGLVLAAFFGGEAYGHHNSTTTTTTTANANTVPHIPSQQEDVFERVITPQYKQNNVQFSRIDFASSSSPSSRSSSSSSSGGDGFVIQADDAELHFEYLSSLPFGDVDYRQGKQLRITVRNTTSGESGIIVPIVQSDNINNNNSSVNSQFYIGYGGESCIVHSWITGGGQGGAGGKQMILSNSGVSQSALNFVSATTFHVMTQLQSVAHVRGGALEGNNLRSFACWITCSGVGAGIFSACGIAAAACGAITVATIGAGAGTCVLGGAACFSAVTLMAPSCYDCITE